MIGVPHNFRVDEFSGLCRFTGKEIAQPREAGRQSSEPSSHNRHNSNSSRSSLPQLRSSNHLTTDTSTAEKGIYIISTTTKLDELPIQKYRLPTQVLNTYLGPTRIAFLGCLSRQRRTGREGRGRFLSNTKLLIDRKYPFLGNYF